MADPLMPSPEASGDERTNLARSLTLASAVLYGLGITIGAGIYVLIGVAAGRAGLHAPLAFVAAAIIMAFTAATFAELGTRMPVSASEAAYVGAAFGRERLTLAVGLLSIAIAIVSAATISVGSAGYIGVFLPLDRHWIVAGVILSMGVIASRATEHSVGFASLMTLIEVGGLLLIVAAGLSRPDTITRLPDLLPPGGDPCAWLGIGQTAMVAVFAFLGFEHLANISEELKEPRRNLPRALFITLGLTTLLYALVTWVAVIAVPPVELAHSEAPLALVFTRLTGWPVAVMSAIAIVATVNGVIVNMIVIARVLFGLARLGHLSGHFARVHPETRAPLPATAVGVLAILVLALAFPLEGLANLASTGTLLIFAIVNLALIRIKNRGDTPPPEGFVCPLWVPWLGAAGSVVLLAVDVLSRAMQ